MDPHKKTAVKSRKGHQPGQTKKPRAGQVIAEATVEVRKKSKFESSSSLTNHEFKTAKPKIPSSKAINKTNKF